MKLAPLDPSIQETTRRLGLLRQTLAGRYSLAYRGAPDLWREHVASDLSYLRSALGALRTELRVNPPTRGAHR